MTRLAVWLCFAGTVAGCGLFVDEGTYTVRGEVTAWVTAEALSITNGTEAPVYTFVVGWETSTVIDWAPTLDGPTLPPGETWSVPRAELENVRPSEPGLHVYWWHANRRGTAPGPIQSITLALNR